MKKRTFTKEDKLQIIKEASENGVNPKEDKGGDESETNLKEDVEKPEKIEGEDEIKIKGKDIESNDSFSNILKPVSTDTS